MKKPSWLDKQLKVWFVLVLLVSSIFVSSWATATFSQKGSALPTGSLSVTIVPNDVKLSKGQSETLFALSNGTSPFSYEWYANGTEFASGSYNATFTLLEEKNYIITVEVTDFYGRKGIGNTFILDPATINIYLDDLPATAFFTIKTDGTNYWAVRYDGYKAYEGTVASTVINNAIGALTASRTCKEMVALRGSFTLTAKIQPRNYTILDLRQATLINSGITQYLIENYDTTNGNKYIEIIGGEIDWNDGGTAPKVIRFVKVNDSFIDGIFLHEVPSGSDSYAISFTTCLRCDVRNSRFDDIASCGIIFVGACQDCNMINCKTTNFGGGSGVSAMYLLYGNSGANIIRCNIINCESEQTTGTDGRGVQIYRYAQGCKIIGGYYKATSSTTSNSISLIQIGHSSAPNTVADCGVYESTVEGKNADSSAGGTVGVVIRDKVTVMGLKITGASTGIYVTNGASLIIGNTIDGYFDAGISYDSAGSFQLITENQITNGGSYGMNIASGNNMSRIHGNVIRTCTTGIRILSGYCDITDNTIYYDTTSINDSGTGNTDADNRKVEY